MTLSKIGLKPMTFSKVTISVFALHQIWECHMYQFLNFPKNPKHRVTFGRYRRIRLMTLNNCLAFPSASILLVELNKEYGWQGNPAQYKLTSGRPKESRDPLGKHTHHDPPSNIVDWNSLRLLREDVRTNPRPYASSCRKQGVNGKRVKSVHTSISPAWPALSRKNSLFSGWTSDADLGNPNEQSNTI